MVSLTKLDIVALFFIFLLSVCADPCCSASSLHQRETGFSDCQNGYRKLGFIDCDNNAGGLTNMGRGAWSQSLKKAKSPPPAPAQRVASRYGGAPPPAR